MPHPSLQDRVSCRETHRMTGFTCCSMGAQRKEEEEGEEEGRQEEEDGGEGPGRKVALGWEPGPQSPLQLSGPRPPPHSVLPPSSFSAPPPRQGLYSSLSPFASCLCLTGPPLLLLFPVPSLLLLPGTLSQDCCLFPSTPVPVGSFWLTVLPFASSLFLFQALSFSLLLSLWICPSCCHDLLFSQGLYFSMTNSFLQPLSPCLLTSCCSLAASPYPAPLSFPGAPSLPRYYQLWLVHHNLFDHEDTASYLRMLQASLTLNSA